MTWLLLSTAGGQFSSQTENKIEEEEGQGDEEDRVGPVLLDHHGLRQRQVQPLPRQLPPLRTAKDLRAVQAEVRVRQAGRHATWNFNKGLKSGP